MNYDIFMKYAGSLNTGCFAGQSLQVRSGYLTYELAFSSRGLEYKEYLRNGELMHSSIIYLPKQFEETGYSDVTMVIFPEEFLLIPKDTGLIYILNHDRTIHCDKSADLLRDKNLAFFNATFNSVRDPKTLFDKETYLFKDAGFFALWSYYDGSGCLSFGRNVYFYKTGGKSKLPPIVTKDWQGRLWLMDADDPSKYCGFPYCLDLL